VTETVQKANAMPLSTSSTILPLMLMSISAPTEAGYAAPRAAPDAEAGTVISYRDLRDLRRLSDRELRLVRGGQRLRPPGAGDDPARLWDTIRGMDATGVMAMDMWAIGDGEMYATFSFYQ
jgi:hypothetical protein